VDQHTGIHTSHLGHRRAIETVPPAPVRLRVVPFIITIIAVLLVVATGIALWWWRMSARIAPYADERERAAARALARKPANEHVVVVGKRGPGS